MTTSLIVIAALALGQAKGAPEKGTPEKAPTVATQGNSEKQALATKVKKLVAQLDDDSQDRRGAAEKALIEIGPDLLDVLPPAGAKASIEMKARLARVRATVEKAHIESFTKPAVVSLQGKMKLAAAIAAVEKQSGNTLIDAREEFNQTADNRDVTLNLDKVSFWQALDQLCDAADLTVYNYNDMPGQLRLMNATPGDVPRSQRGSYTGLFRLEAKKLEATRELRNPQGNSLRITADIAWEPRIRPIVLELPLAELKATDEKGEEMASSGEGNIEVPIEGSNAGVEIDLQLALPKRSVTKIASVKGQFTALVPGRIETFEFSKLDKVKNESIDRGSVVVTLEQVRKNEDVLEARLRIKFDKSANALESHRGWIDENEAYMLDPKGKKIEPGGRERNLVDENEVGYSYYFDPEEAPGDKCRFVYKTPAALFKVPVEFELKDLELP